MAKKSSKGKVSPHKSFKRSYREDYQRELEIPGIMHHIFASFSVIFKNWKLFLPFLAIMVVLNIAFVGIMSETNYVQFQDVLEDANMKVAGGNLGGVAKSGMLLASAIASGGLAGGSNEAAVVLGVILFLVIWLVTIFLLRHLLAGRKVKLREGLYNAMAPMASTFVVFLVAVLECIPIFVLIIAVSAAIQTEFLAMPFYALLFFIFAALMILISGYLLSSSLMAFAAVSAPGLYPMKALNTASDLMMGRRIRFVIRLIALVMALIIVWAIVMMPLIGFDLWLKQFAWTHGLPFVPFCLVVMTCFTEIYVTAYLYIYYRWMLGYDEK